MTSLERSSMSIDMQIVFRLAARSDLPKLEWFGMYRHYRNLFMRSFREQLRGRRLMLVADCEGFPVGQIFIQLKSNDSLYANGNDRAYLYSLRVMEMFQHKGIGTRLLHEAEAYVMERGFSWTTIAAAKDNEGARRLYERLGYRVFGEDPGQWSYVDHEGRTRFVAEPCWTLEKALRLR